MAIPRFDGVELFLQIVESGNLTEAAERLNLTRSAVGKGLARLEARLGTRLLQRSTRRQRLTEDGQAYYEHCLRALAELEAAESVLESGRQQPRGRLRASLPLAFDLRALPPGGPYALRALELTPSGGGARPRRMHGGRCSASPVGRATVCRWR